MVPKESPSCIVYSAIIIFEFAQQLRTLGPLKARVVCVLSTNSAAVIGILEVEKKYISPQIWRWDHQNLLTRHPKESKNVG